MNESRALELLGRGSILVLTHTDEGDKWSIEPQGKWVLPQTAANLIAKSNIRPRTDSLLPAVKPQTWAMDQVETVPA